MADYKVLRLSDNGSGWQPVDAPDRVTTDISVHSVIIAPSGASFPAIPTANEWFWRTDTSTLYRRDSANMVWEPASGSAALGSEAFYPHGFVDQSSSVVSFNYSVLTLKIEPVVDSFTFYWQGQKYIRSSSNNKVLAGTDGLHFVYYDSTGTLQESTTPWDLKLHVPVATVYLNTTLGSALLQEERHMTNMPWATRYLLHNTIGTRYKSGLSISGYTLNTDTDAAVTFGMSDGTICDEDIIINVTNAAVPANPFEQVLTDPAQIPVFYRVGVNGVWTWDAPTDFFVKNGGTGRVSYNQYTGGAWQQTDGANGDFIAYWIFTTNNLLNPVISLQGQRLDATLNNARANNTLESLNLGGLPAAEMKALYRIIVRTNTGYGGTRKFMISDVSDYRTASAVPGMFVPTSHSSLGDLNTSGHPAEIISVNSGGFSGQLPTTATTVQLALESTDTHTHAIKAGVVPNASFAGNPKTATVTFTTPYPDTNYAITHVIYVDGSSNASFIATVQNKTVNGFDLSLHTGNINDVIDVEWITKPIGE